jgi:hypothetical protein
MSIYAYNAKIVALGPRNFLTAEIDLGFGMKINQSLQINGISEFASANAWMSTNVLGRNVTIKTVKDELGYGVEVYMLHNGKETNLSDELINRKLATLFVY